MSKRGRSQKRCVRKVNLVLRELKEAKRYAERRKIIFAKKGVARSLLQLGKSLRYIDRLENSKIKDPIGAAGATGVTRAIGAIGSFQQFQVSENTPNTTGSSAIPITSVATTLKTITIIGVSTGSRVWLTGIVGWEATTGNTSLAAGRRD
ncbi:hypothetical protein [Paenibacillus sp. JJ1683]